MEISYDKEADAVYLGLKDAEFSRNKKIDDALILDLDADGSVIGIELLDVSKRIPAESLAKLYVKNLSVVES